MSAPVESDSGIFLAITFACLAFVIGIVLYFVSSSTKRPRNAQRPGEETAGARPRGVPTARQEGRPVRAGGVRRRAPRQRMQRPQQDESPDEEEVLMAQEAIFEDTEGSKKIGTKKMRKLEEKAAKKAAREQELEDREDRKRRQEELDERRRLRDQEIEEEEKQQEEAERQRKEEEARKEHEEYLKIKESFIVEEEGQEQILSAEESQSLLQEFIDYIKNNKVVVLEELAAQFNMRTQDAIKRVQELQEEGRLTGVIDDRGKFIYISEEEMDAVAKFIRQRGRVSITELAAASNKLINLEPESTSISVQS